MQTSQLAARDDIQEIVQQLATLIERRDYAHAAHEFVTDLAVRFGVDRVSLGWVRGRRVDVQGVSHTERFDAKSSLVRCIAQAMEEAVDQGTRLTYPQELADDQETPRILRCHGALAAQPGSGVVHSIPVGDGERIYGVLTLESESGCAIPSGTLDRCEATLCMLAPVLQLKWRDARAIGPKLWDATRDGWLGLFEPGNDRRKFLAIAAGLLFLFVLIGRGEHRVSARAYLEGSVQRAAVAPFDGYVGTAPVRAGTIVREGALLCTLDPRELELELKRWESERDKLSRQKQSALAEMDAVKLRVTSAELEQAEARRALAAFKLEQMEIAAPIAGVVVTGDLSQSIGAPVSRGDVLFEVAPLDSYRLILEVDERDIAHVLEDQSGTAMLSALPGREVPFTVTCVTPVSTAEDGRNFFRVEAAVSEEVIRDLRPGMAGRGKIETGSRSFLWLWTHDVFDWVRLGLWNWLP